MRLAALCDRLRRDHWLALLACALVVYFSYHALNGSRGLLAWRQYSVELEATYQELARLRVERAELEQKVMLLRNTSVDPDLLDEVARGMLSLVEPVDVIILLDDVPEWKSFESRANY